MGEWGERGLVGRRESRECVRGDVEGRGADDDDDPEGDNDEDDVGSGDGVCMIGEKDCNARTAEIGEKRS